VFVEVSQRRGTLRTRPWLSSRGAAPCVALVLGAGERGGRALGSAPVLTCCVLLIAVSSASDFCLQKEEVLF